jgi:Kef-type K+ transport system membrane component KefB
MSPLRRVASLASIGLTLPAAAFASSSGAHAADDLTRLLVALALILLAGRLHGALYESLRLPGVLGELAAGIVLGNLNLLGTHVFDGLRDLAGIELLAQLGVIFLLFEVGLHSDIAKMVQVGASSLLVATLGVIAPISLGYGVSAMFFPAHHPLSHWFVGATLCATSVGITARVLADLGRIQSAEGRIILGAAVIDDVQGLIVLAVLNGIIDATNRGHGFETAGLIVIVGKALGFLAAAIVIGRWLSARVFHLARHLSGPGVLLSLALAFCFGLAALAALAGLAPIVGAFAAGLILDEVHYRELRARDQRQRTIPELLEPMRQLLAPVFFVLMGMRVDLHAFAAPGVLAFAAVLTVAAALGKQVCSLGVLERGVDRVAVGLGMIPRGEVGLIFANIGLTLTMGAEHVIDDTVFAAVVVMIAITTLVTPPLLVWRLRSAGREK